MTTGFRLDAGVLRLPAEKPDLGFGNLRHLYLPRLLGEAPRAGRAPELREVRWPFAAAVGAPLFTQAPPRARHRSIDLDTWYPDQVARMVAGGNANAAAFFRQHGVNPSAPLDPKAKYSSRAASLYRQQLDKLAKKAGVPDSPDPEPAQPAPDLMSQLGFADLSLDGGAPASKGADGVPAADEGANRRGGAGARGGRLSFCAPLSPLPAGSAGHIARSVSASAALDRKRDYSSSPAAPPTTAAPDTGFLAASARGGASASAPRSPAPRGVLRLPGATAHASNASGGGPSFSAAGAGAQSLPRASPLKVSNFKGSGKRGLVRGSATPWSFPRYALRAPPSPPNDRTPRSLAARVAASWEPSYRLHQPPRLRRRRASTTIRLGSTFPRTMRPSPRDTCLLRRRRPPSRTRPPQHHLWRRQVGLARLRRGRRRTMARCGRVRAWAGALSQ